MNHQELWKEIPGWPNYEASTLGRIRSIARVIWIPTRQVHRRLPTTILHGIRTKHGYLRHGLIRKHVFAHVLVALAFVPNPDGKPFVNHKDGQKTNNLPDNLEWSTKKENNDHAAHVLRVSSCYKPGELNPASKLSFADVACIREEKGRTAQKTLAARFHTSQANISAIQLGKRWK